MKVSILSILLFIFFIPEILLGQVELTYDSISSEVREVDADTVMRKQHSAHKASIYSMVLPGLGQAYNRKYWKIPIVYAGFGVVYYFVSFNNSEYQEWREAYNHALQNADGSEPPINEYEEKYGYDTDILKDQKDYYRRNRDLSYILGGVWYLLNIVDAAVDAHLFSWEVDEDLSLRVEPAFYQPLYGQKVNGGVKLTMHFR
ncbi:MAG: DUF5683 domain-containing protein [Bacteroidales bacterium]